MINPLVAALAGASSQQPFLSYLNFNQGIRISYPPDWRKLDQSSPAGFIAVFGSPQEDISDRFSENLNIFIESIPPGLTLEQYAQGCMQGMSQQPIQFLENAQTTLAGRPAYRFVFIGPLQAPVPMSGKFLQHLIVANSKGYVVTYTAELQKYDKFLPVIQQMLNSLEIK